MKIVDTNFQMNEQAAKILKLLTSKECNTENWFGDVEVDVETTLWYNGRERGFCLRFTHNLDVIDSLYIVVTEVRNGDNIQIEIFGSEDAPAKRETNPPTPHMYKNNPLLPHRRLLLEPGSYKKACTKIYDIATAYVQSRDNHFQVHGVVNS